MNHLLRNLQTSFRLPAMLMLAVAVSQAVPALAYDSRPFLEGINAIRLFNQSASPGEKEAHQKKVSILVEKALDNSPAYREQKQNVSAASADIGAARGQLSPQIRATAQSRQTDGDVTAATKANGKPSVALAGELVLYDWGRINAQIDGRVAAESASRARMVAVANQVASEAITTCLEFKKQVALREVANTYIESIRKFVQMLTTIVDYDPGRSSEMVQAKSRMLQAESNVLLVASKQREISVRLTRIFGGEDQSICEQVEGSFRELPNKEAVLNLIPSIPQIVALGHDLNQQKKQVDQFAASKKPLVQFTAGYTPANPSVSNNYISSVAVVVTAPLFDGGVLDSNQKAALERTGSIEERRDQLKRQLHSELTERWVQANTNFTRADDFIGLLEINNRVRKDFFQQWAELGRRSMYELLAIEQEQFQLESNYVSALYDALSLSAQIRGISGQFMSFE
jgi:adhesin transport system outer membrane protein